MMERPEFQLGTLLLQAVSFLSTILVRTATFLRTQVPIVAVPGKKLAKSCHKLPPP